MITLAATNTIQGDAGTATAVTYTISGMELSGSTETYKVLAQGQLALAAGALYTVPDSTTAFVKSIMLANTTASPVIGVTLFLNGTAAGNQILSGLTLAAYGTAILDDNGLKVYDASGNLYTSYTGMFDTTAVIATAPTILSTPGTSVLAARRDHTHRSPGGIWSMYGTSAALNTTETVLLGCTLPASFLAQNTTLRVTASGTCTSSAANASNFRFRIGTAGTTSDAVAAIVTPTSATSGSSVPFRVELLFTVRTTGASGTAVGSGVLWNNGILGISSSAYPVVAQVTSPITIDTTAQTQVKLWYVSAATTTTSTFYNAVIEVVMM